VRWETELREELIGAKSGCAQEERWDHREDQQRQRDNTEGGRVEEVQMVNFMKHDNMRVRLGRNLTFIVGHNGSGKSAVQQAIYLALNGRARSNDRGSVSSLLKSGTAGGHVRVSLQNGGADAYRHSLFGNRITVYRKVGSKSPGASLKLLSESGATISPKPKTLELSPTEPEIRAPARELASICDHFNIDVDNPITVMSQTNSKEFLQGSNNFKHYQLFMKATLLQSVREQLSSANDKVTKVREKLNAVEEELKTQDAEVGEKRKRLQSLEELDDMYEKANTLRKQLNWAYVDDKEVDITIYRASLGDPNTDPPESYPDWAKTYWGSKKKGLRAAEEKQADAASRLQQAEAEKENAAHELRAEQEKTQELKQRTQQSQSELERLRGEQREAEQRKNAINRERREYDDSLKSVQKRLEEEKSKHERLMQSEDMSDRERKAQQEANRLFEKIEEKRAEQAEVQKQESTLQSESAELQQKLESRTQNWKDKRSEVDWIDQEVKNKEGEVRNLEKQKASSAMFGHSHQKQVLEAIHHRGEGNFMRKPLGPLGAYLSLTDQRWKLVAEVAIEGSLDQVVLVDNHQDNKEFQRLAQAKIGRKLNTVIAPFDRPMFNVKQQEGVLTLFDVLKSEENVVLNYLIGRHKTDNTALAESQEELENVVFSGSYGLGYLADGTRARGVAGAREWHPLESQRKQRPNPRLGTDKADIIDGHKNELNRMKEQQKALHEELRKIGNEHNSGNEALKEKQRERQQMKDKETKLSKEIECLTKEANAQQNVSGQQQRESEIEQVNEAIRTLLSTYQESESANKAAEGRLRDAEQEAERVYQELSKKDEEMREFDRQARELTRSDNPSRASYEKKEEEVKKVQQELENAKAKVEKHKRAVNDAHETLEKYEEELADLQKTAKETCSREELEKLPEAPKPKETDNPLRATSQEPISLELNKVEKKISTMQRTTLGANETVESLRNDFEQKNAQCKKRRKQLDDAKEPCNKMRKMLKSRWEVQDKHESTTAATVDQQFQEILNKRHFQGHMDVDFENARINMKVTPPGDKRGKNNEGQSKRSTDMKQLSGGERSYTTLAFLLAVCKEAETPFFCADEFDVFMDEGNRERALLELVNYAQKKQSAQFIILTPNDISPVQQEIQKWRENAQENNLVKIVSMGSRST
jgi:chromosome segregation ATPase